MSPRAYRIRNLFTAGSVPVHRGVPGAISTGDVAIPPWGCIRIRTRAMTPSTTRAAISTKKIMAMTG
jgi:hypothetical protein